MYAGFAEFINYACMMISHDPLALIQLENDRQRCVYIDIDDLMLTVTHVHSANRAMNI